MIPPSLIRSSEVYSRELYLYRIVCNQLTNILVWYNILSPQCVNHHLPYDSVPVHLRCLTACLADISAIGRCASAPLDTLPVYVTWHKARHFALLWWICWVQGRARMHETDVHLINQVVPLWYAENMVSRDEINGVMFCSLAKG